MTSRQRVYPLSAGACRSVPIFMWFHPDTARHLALAVEIPAAHVPEAMGNDIRQNLGQQRTTPWKASCTARRRLAPSTSGGVKWVKRHSFNQIEAFPLARHPRAGARIRFPRSTSSSCWASCTRPQRSQ